MAFSPEPFLCRRAKKKEGHIKDWLFDFLGCTQLVYTLALKWSIYTTIMEVGSKKTILTTVLGTEFHNGSTYGPSGIVGYHAVVPYTMNRSDPLSRNL